MSKMYTLKLPEEMFDCIVDFLNNEADYDFSAEFICKNKTIEECAPQEYCRNCVVEKLKTYVTSEE